MKKSHIELLIVALMAIPIGAYGVSALLAHRMWVAPRNARPFEMVGSGAVMMGLAYLAMAVGLFSVWFAFRTPYRKSGFAVTGLCALLAGVCFAMALTGQ